MGPEASDPSETPELSAKVVAVIMVEGPNAGTRFRPLSFKVAAPLFPLAGQPMVHFPVKSCKKIPNLVHIYVLGTYEERELSSYCSTVSTALEIPITYLRGDRDQGSAGNLHSFKDLILESDPDDIVVLNCDVCCTFPLEKMYEAHKSFGGVVTMMIKKVRAELASRYGELVADPATKELLHYTEKPAIFVGEHRNCGAYILRRDAFVIIADVAKSRRNKEALQRLNSLEALQSATMSVPSDCVTLDKDIVKPMAGKKQIYTYETSGFWEQIESPGSFVRCSGLYLKQLRGVLPRGKQCEVEGNVYVHPSAKIHPTAKIGANVSVSPNARIGPGVRLKNCIILDDVEVQDNALVMHAIIGWKSTLGKWSRVEGDGDYTQKLGIAVLGEDVKVNDEVVVIKSLVLPHKELKASVNGEIIL